MVLMGTDWGWVKVLGSNGEKSKRGDQGFSAQPAASSSWDLGACSQLPPCSIGSQGKAARKRRFMAAVTVAQATWGKMEVTTEVSSGHNSA